MVPHWYNFQNCFKKKKKKKMVLGYFFQLAASCGQGAQVEVK
jgi:hypothetical protein